MPHLKPKCLKYFYFSTRTRTEVDMLHGQKIGASIERSTKYLLVKYFPFKKVQVHNTDLLTIAKSNTKE